MNKFKEFFSDIRNNVIAFAIYIFAYQIIALPYMADNLDVDINAQLLLFISISSIITQSLGNELAILYQVVFKKYDNYDSSADLMNLYHKSTIGTGIGLLLLLPFLNFTLTESIMLSLTAALTNSRLFLQGPLRLKKKFNKLAIGNLLYMVGILLAIYLFQFIGVLFWLPFLLAELLSVSYLGYLSKNTLTNKLKTGKHYTENRGLYFELAFSTLLNKIPDYADKILVLPILGSEAMSAYFAGTTVSKALFLLVNPINSVLLSWLSSDDTSDEKKIIKIQLKVNLIVVIFIFIISLPLTYLVIGILYQQFLDIVLGIVVPLSLLSAFTIAASLLRVVFLRYYDLKILKYINLIHILTFILFAPFGAYFYGLKGFTYAVALSKGLFWLSFFAVLYNYAHKKENADKVN